jgi:hypothetical protein
MVPVDIDVWLDTERTGNLITVIPYVRTAEEMKVHYDVVLLRKGTSIKQSGNVLASATKPGGMGRMTVNSGDGNESCRINIVLQTDGSKLGQYEFDCPS